MSKNERLRYWSFIGYPESLIDDWENILSSKYHLQWVCSPLHDKDTDKTGNIKKAHYHCLLYFAGKKSYKQIKDLTDEIGATIPQKVYSVTGLLRYMAHLDDPDKAQYPISEIKSYNGFNLEKHLEGDFDDNEDLIIFNEIYTFCEKENISNLSFFISYVMNNNSDWFKFAHEKNNYTKLHYYFLSRKFLKDK